MATKQKQMWQRLKDIETAIKKALDSGMTYKEISDRCVGISPSAVSRFMSGCMSHQSTIEALERAVQSDALNHVQPPKQMDRDVVSMALNTIISEIRNVQSRLGVIEAILSTDGHDRGDDEEEMRL